MVKTKEILSGFTAKELARLSAARLLMDQQGKLLGRQRALAIERGGLDTELAKVKRQLRKIERRLVRSIKEFTPNAAAIVRPAAKPARGRRRARRRPDLAAAMEKALSKHPGGLASERLAATVVASGYPGKAPQLRGVVGRLAAQKKDRFIALRGGVIRLPGGALNIPAGTKAGPKKEAAAAAAGQPRLSQLVVDELRRKGAPLHANELAERLLARGYTTQQTNRPFAHVIQSMLAAQVKRGVLRKTAPATFMLGKKAEPAKV